MTESKFEYGFKEGSPEIAIVTLGENVLGGSEALEFNSIMEELGGKGVMFVIIGLKKVKVMNSSGLGMLVSALSSLRKRNITLYLAEPADKVKNLLKITHLDEVFKIYDSIEEAFANCY